MYTHTIVHIQYKEYLTIIPRARVVHELIVNEVRSAELAVNSLRRERVE